MTQGLDGSPVPILLVEDDVDVMAAVGDLLASEGYEVSSARSGQVALSLLQAGYRPAVMVVDFAMPEMDGGEFLRSCREVEEWVRIPAIVMSAFRPDDMAAVGIAEYLPKPFSPDDLLLRLAHLPVSCGDQTVRASRASSYPGCGRTVPGSTPAPPTLERK
jgi:CheY-like chemotaxis protein